MELHEALYTTRAMRRVRPDPIPIDVQARILDAAIRAPSGGNSQPWRFVLVDSPAVKAEFGPLYRDSIATLWDTIYKERLDRARLDPERRSNQSLLKVQRSAQWLADHYEDVPLYLFGFVRRDGGASFDLPGGLERPARPPAPRGSGARSRPSSAGSTRRRFAASCSVPDDSWTNACMISFGYPTGRWAVAERLPVDKVAARNSWEGALGFSVPEPLWPGSLEEQPKFSAS